MTNIMRLGLAGLLIASSLAAQTNSSASGTLAADTTVKEAPKKVSLYRPMDINHLRPAHQPGVNVFESPEQDQVPFNGFALSFGGAFTQEFRASITIAMRRPSSLIM